MDMELDGNKWKAFSKSGAAEAVQQRSAKYTSKKYDKKISSSPWYCDNSNEVIPNAIQRQYYKYATSITSW